MGAKPEHEICVFVPAGERRVKILVFVHNPQELESVRVCGVSHARIQQTIADTIFVIPKDRKRRRSPTP